MNTVDREMIVEAAELLHRAAVLTRPGEVAVEAWAHNAADWMERALAMRMLTVEQATRRVTVRGDTNTPRWRPINAEGEVSPDPAPETPDDPDEGETGPAETTL